MRLRIYAILVICCVCVLGFSGFATAKDNSLTITPDVVNINAFFAGQKLALSGTVATSEDVIIEVTGKNVESHFDLKGRTGPFWMTQGKVIFDNVPELYMVLLPKNMTGKTELKPLGLGMTHLEENAKISGTVDVPKESFGMFTELKTFEHLFKSIPDAVHYTDNMKTRQFNAECELPALLGTGTYHITATVVSDGKIQRQMNRSFEVKQVGFVKLVDDLASNRRIIYGVSAVIIALSAGLIMGVLFKQDGGAH